MGFASALLATFSFRTLPVTIFAFLIYAAVFVTLEVTDQLAPAPSAGKQHDVGLNLSEAYGDLHAITSRPHPFNSRQNDQVRSYLLERLKNIARDHDFIHVLDDETTSVHLDGLQAVYFQGNNLVVKVDGTEDYAEGNAILFSAHFDSVSTSPGATDDGMGVVSLVQMVSYLSNNRPRRTFIANINNGEEDGLNGAHSYLAHPWSNLTKTFVNFEGAGSGGRPFLFRANSLPILRAFTSGNVPHPHAFASSADAFAQGVIRSETDYAVYSGQREPSLTGGPRAADHTGYRGPGGGMRGADVAFYQNRARYHTPEDSIRAMGHEGSQRALWAMMEVARGAGAALLGASEGSLGEDVVGNAEPSTYFELFAAYLVAFPLRILMAIFIVILVVGPVVALILGFFMYRQTHKQNAHNVRWVAGLKGYGRFWLALLITIGLHVALVVGYLKLNPYTVHANSVAVVMSLLSLSYLAFTLSLSVAQYFRPVPPAKQKFAVLLGIYLLTWALLVASTVVTGGMNVAGLYWIGAWNASAFIALVWGMIESLAGKGHGGREIILPPPNGGNDEAAHPAPAQSEGAHHDHDQDNDEDATERTPLIGRWRRRVRAPEVVANEKAQDQAVLWWILQMLFSIPVPVYLIGCIARLWVQSMAQTAPDGGWAGIIYIPFSLLSILLLLPLAPFVHKLPGKLNTLILVIFIASTAYAWLIWPFNTSDSRLKVFFQSHVHLANMTDRIGNPVFQRAETQLSGVPGYVDRVVRELPSSLSASVLSYGAQRPGLMTHSWPVEQRYIPSVQGEWLNASALRVNASTARFSISGSDTRACRIYFDNHDVASFRARSKGEKKWRELSVSQEGVRRVALWSRSWDDSFDVEVTLAGEYLEQQQVQGRVACLWAEVDGVWAGEGKGGVRIPALEELLAFMPEWAIVTKYDAGLVEAQSGFLL